MTITRMSILLKWVSWRRRTKHPEFDILHRGAESLLLSHKAPTMQYLLLIYTDAALMEQLPAEQYDAHMRDCLQHADALQACGKLVGFQQLESAASAKSVRVRAGTSQVLDGPFAETKEMLAGFNLIEADSMEEAVRMAHEFPWTRYGCIEVRAVRDVAAVRKRVGASTT
jgi:hypothetical protein